MITLDWDNIKQTTLENRIKMIMRTLLYLGYRDDFTIYYRESCNRKGYHIKIVGIENDFKLRKMFWDDPIRLKMDIERKKQGFPINVLFSRKTYPDGTIKEAGKWRKIK